MSNSSIEEISYEHIPLEQRNGTAKELFFTWFAASTVSTTLVTGSLAIVLGLNFWWSLVAILLGHGIGATIMALHSATGPKAGLPQVVQSRAQFGYFGAILPMLIILIMYLGYGATNTVLVGQGVEETLGLNMNVTVIVSLIPMVLLAIFGQGLLQKSMKIYTIGFTVVFIILSIMILMNVSMELLNAGTFSFSQFLLMTSICVTWQITYGPYVSDHSRFIHPSQSRKVFTYSYLGSFASSVWLMVLGAAIATMVVNGNVMAQIKDMGSLGFIIALLLSLGVLVINSLNIYGAGIIILSIASNFLTFKTSARLRTITSIAIGIIIALIATWSSDNFMANFQLYLGFILFFIIPWSMITLTDFYILKRVHYPADEFNKKDGIFGKINIPTMIIYLLTIFIQIPFINTELYVGPIAKMLDGLDIAWIIGGAVSFLLYISFAKLTAPAKLTVDVYPTSNVPENN